MPWFSKLTAVFLLTVVGLSECKLYSLPSPQSNGLEDHVNNGYNYWIPPRMEYLPCRDNFTVACFRSKADSFLDRLNKIEDLELTSWLRIVKSGQVHPVQPMDIKAKMDGYFTSHSFRVSLPEGITAVTSPRSAPSPSIDINMSTAVDTFTGRRKKNKGGMGMYMMGLMGKLGMMAMAMIKLKAIKALMISLVALILSKIQLFKMLSMKSGGGGEHVIVVSGGHGGGHGGGGGGGHGGGGHDSYGPSGGGGGGGGWSSGGGYGSGGDSHSFGGGGGGGGGYSYGGGNGGSSHGGGNDWQSGGSSGSWGGGGGGGGGSGWNNGGGGGGSGWNSGGSSGGWSKRNYLETDESTR